MKGKYSNNVATTTGGVFDMLSSYEFEPTAKFTLVCTMCILCACVFLWEGGRGKGEYRLPLAVFSTR
jgi:hypothetical protein